MGAEQREADLRGKAGYSLSRQEELHLGSSHSDHPDTRLVTVLVNRGYFVGPTGASRIRREHFVTLKR